MVCRWQDVVGNGFGKQRDGAFIIGKRTCDPILPVYIESYCFKCCQGVLMNDGFFRSGRIKTDPFYTQLIGKG